MQHMQAKGLIKHQPFAFCKITHPYYITHFGDKRELVICRIWTHVFDHESCGFNIVHALVRLDIQATNTWDVFQIAVQIENHNICDCATRIAGRLHLVGSHFIWVNILLTFAVTCQENLCAFYCVTDGKEGKNKETNVVSSTSSTTKPKVKNTSSIAGIALCWQGVVQRQVRHVF